MIEINRASNYSIELTGDELGAVLSCIAKAPYENVAGLIGKIKDQVIAQNVPSVKE